MTKGEKEEQRNLPPCSNPYCLQSRVVRNESYRGRQRYQCRTCMTYMGETKGRRCTV